MSFLTKLQYAHPNGSRPGIMRDLITTAEYSGVSYLAGYVVAKAAQPPTVLGLPLSLAVGLGSKIASLAATGFGVGGMIGGLRPHLDVFGNAWLGNYFGALGARAGFAKSGRVVAVGPADAMRKVPGATILGISEPVPPGAMLSASAIERLAQNIRR